MLAATLAACTASVSPPEPGPPEELVTETYAIVGTLDTLDGTMGSIEEADISMAWQDLNRDLRSLIDEAVREPDKTRLDGVNARIGSFRSRFESHEAMEETETHWDRLTTALDRLQRRLVAKSP